MIIKHSFCSFRHKSEILHVYDSVITKYTTFISVCTANTTDLVKFIMYY